MLNIFIIGPMPTGGSKNGAIKDALISILEKLENKPEYRIKTPDELTGGNIDENVFYEMDVADLVIADLTYRSPNVFYEIAMLHSMGKPLVCIDFVQANDQAIPFYLNHTNILRITDSNNLQKYLNPFISRFLDLKAYTNYSSSVISQYYGLPLVDISAVMGVAFGYYTNFLRPFLKRNTGAIANEVNEVSELIIIKPTNLSQEDKCKETVKSILEDAEEKLFKTIESPRGVVFCQFYKEQKAYDVPSALFTLRKSPRFKKLKNILYNLQNLDAQLKTKAMRKYENQVIDKFFRHLEYLIQVDDGELNNTYQILKLEELKP